MSRSTRLFATVLGFSIAAAAVEAGGCEPDGRQASGAVYRICMPESWNGDLVLFAHGYVGFNEPVRIPEEQLVLPDGTLLPTVVNSLGYAFATTSYSTNGLAIQPGIDDVVDLVHVFADTHGAASRVLLVGVSEGGVVTALSVERHPEVFAGGLAACGAVGSFRKQADYHGDFRAVFDYFFPGVIPGRALEVPPDVIEHFSDVYAPRISEAIRQDPHGAQQLLAVTGAAFDPSDPSTVEQTILDLTWYTVFATNDGIEKLGGSPFDNHRKRYSGSDDDALLNRNVERFVADPAALDQIQRRYETSGRLTAPLVTLHTTGDAIVPYWNEPLYLLKTVSGGSLFRHANVRVSRYGHCNFTENEVLHAFSILQLLIGR